MCLNEISHVHKLIRKTCALIEEKEHVKLVTDLGEEFEEVIFASKEIFCIIDFKNKTWLYKGRAVQKETESLIDDAIIYLFWLEMGRKYKKM